MNTFEYEFFINDKFYYLYVDSSDDKKRIVINSKELVNEKYTLSFNRKAYILYYPIVIDGNELVVSIDDTPITHVYNLYLNNVSLLDATKLDDSYSEAKNILEKGFSDFVKDYWFAILKENIGSFLGTVFTLSVIGFYTIREFFVKFVLIFLIVPLTMPVFLAGEWIHYKNIVRKFRDCFRPRVVFE